MQPVSELRSVVAGRSALVLGKGPSLTAESFATHRVGRCVFGINQTVRSFDCDVAFFIDIEPFRESSAEIRQSQMRVVLPWHPNQRTWRKSVSRPMQENLGELCGSDATLRMLEEQGRLFYFHTSLEDRRHADNVFEPNLVSLSALLQVLAALEIRDVRTLGVDGGTGHSTALRGSLYTQLRQGYDKQFPILRDIAMTTGVELSRADAHEVRVFVGCEPEQWLAARVLEYTIRKNTSERVNVQRLHEVIDGSAGRAGGRTPFSCQRFFIPELCGYSGLAIYLDSDMQLFANIRQLLELYEPGQAIVSAEAPPNSARRPQYSVMVLNCELAHWNGRELAKRAGEDYERTMFDFDFEPAKSRSLPYTWNSLERYEPGKTCLLHYTDMDLQPWLSARNPLAPVWVRALCEAVRDGFISFEDVRREVAAGHARPGLLRQVETNEPDPRRISRRERLKDELYVPPHTVARFTRHNGPLVRAGLAVARKAFNAVRGRP